MKRIIILCLLVSCHAFINASTLIYDSYTSMRPSRFSDSEITAVGFPNDYGLKIRDSSLPDANQSGLPSQTIYEYMNFSATSEFKCLVNSNSMPFTEQQTTNNSEDMTRPEIY